MITRLKFLVLILVMIFTNRASAQSIEPDIMEGMWELNFTGEISGISDTMPSVTTSQKQCISKKNALDPQKLLKNQNCNISNLVLQNNTATWNMHCQQQGISMTGEGKLSYQYQTVSGVITMNMSGEAGGMKVTTQMNGQYSGPCQ